MLGATKLANILFAKQLQVVFDQEDVDALSISLNPGGVDTGESESLAHLAVCCTLGSKYRLNAELPTRPTQEYDAPERLDRIPDLQPPQAYR